MVKRSYQENTDQLIAPFHDYKYFCFSFKNGLRLKVMLSPRQPNKKVGMSFVGKLEVEMSTCTYACLFW